MASKDERKQESPTETPTSLNQIEVENQNTHLSSTYPTQNQQNITWSCFNGGMIRPLDHLQSSPYFKMRILAQHLRPLFLQVLRAPDFHNCDAAQGIQEKLKLMQDLCMQKTVENLTMGKYNCVERIQEEMRLPIRNNLESHSISGTYIVGGSSLAWNFIMFPGTKPEYYGKTKEEFRAWK